MSQAKAVGLILVFALTFWFAGIYDVTGLGATRGIIGVFRRPQRKALNGTALSSSRPKL